MNERSSIETTGETVDEAVAKGLEELNVSPTDVLVEVLEEPARGVFGIGSRPARVRLKLLRAPAPPTPAPAPEPVAQEAAPMPTPQPQVEEAEPAAPDAPIVAQDGADIDEEAQVSVEVLSELITHLNIRAEVTVKRADSNDSDESDEDVPWILNVEGRDVNALIGRRGDTLASLQYITRLIVSRRLQSRANIVVDVGGYKQRRSQRLHELALRMADKAVNQERTISLEPMPPHERRMIHMALRNRDDVFTRSTGEGDSRKVTIVPK